MNGHDIAVGIGLILGGAGTLIILVVRSAWAEKQARKAERIIATVARPAVVTPKTATGLDELWLELLVAGSDRVPGQRRPGGQS